MKPLVPEDLHRPSTSLVRGIDFARFAKCLALSSSPREAQHIAEQRYGSASPVTRAITAKAAVDAGNSTDTNWASPLVAARNEFLALANEVSVIGRISNWRRVPFST